MIKRNILYSLKQLPQDCRIALYGSGIISSLFRKLLNKKRRDINVVCLINTFSDGKNEGLDIIKIDNINKSSYIFDYVIVASTLWNEIEEELINRNYKFFKM